MIERLAAQYALPLGCLAAAWCVFGWLTLGVPHAPGDVVACAFLHGVLVVCALAHWRYA